MNTLKIKSGAYALLLLGSCVMLFISSFPHQALAISLKHNSVISDKTLKLGDIFDDLDSYSADRILGLAPRPGQEMVLNARTLMRISRAMDLSWKPENSAQYISLTRAATLIDRDMIEETLRAALQDKGLSGNYNIIFPRSVQDIILPLDQAPTSEISSLSIQLDKNWFEATLVAPSKNNPLETRKIRGTIERLVEIPVLKNNIRHGTVISRHDLDFISVNEKHVKGNLLLDEQDIIGLTPRRVLLAGKPIKDNEVVIPKIVSRGDLVTMIFRAGGLSLTAKGKALEHGAKGDTIRLVNASSHKTVQGLITARNEVLVENF